MPDNNKISLALDGFLVKRLEAIALKTGMSLNNCASQAVFEYIETWEEFYASELFNSDDEEDKFFLRAVND